MVRLISVCSKERGGRRGEGNIEPHDYEEDGERNDDWPITVHEKSTLSSE
jgi:hypothetical protein